MKKIIAGNWKFNKELRDLKRAIKFVEDLEDKLNGTENVEVKIFPHDLVSAELVKRAKKIKIGSQDIHWEEDGSFTGAHFSAQDLASCAIKETLIGHSETRFYFGVTDEKVALKLKSSFENGIFPTICIGEDIEEKERGETERVLREQVKKGILPVLKENSKFLIAYEPIYAIAGFAKLRRMEPKPANLKDIELAHKIIREIFSEQGCPEIKILYGGSSSPENARELLSQPFIDGLLVGTASWNLDSFFEIIKIAEEIEK